MKIWASIKKVEELDIDKRDLANALITYAIEYTGHSNFDDAGCDWYTKDGIVYIGSKDWVFSEDPKVAILVDASNILHYGQILTLEE